MRLNRLLLERYGNFAGVAILFPPDAALHVVHGANEAGKSTALRAIGDMLYGFPTRSTAAHGLRNAALRIGAEIATRDGRTALLFRRKANRDTLRDADDAPVPEQRMQGFLGAAGRDLFETMFGLDCAGLRDGGRDILAAADNAGENLFQAGTGLHGLRDLATRLDQTAAKLFGDGRGPRVFNVELTRFNEACKAMTQRSVGLEEWQACRRRIAAAESLLAQADRQHAELSLRRTIADRIRRTAPALRDRAAAQAALASMGNVPDLPEDASTRRYDALLQRSLASEALARATTDIERLNAELASLPEPSRLAARAPEITAINERRIGAQDAARDRPRQVARAEAARAAIDRRLFDLGRALSAEDAVAQLPGSLAQQQVRRLAKEAVARQRHEDEAAALSAAREKTRLLAAQLATEAEAPDLAALRPTIAAIRAEGDLDAAIAKQQREVARRRNRLAAACQSLVPSAGDAARIAALPVPQPETVRRFGRALKEAADAHARSAERCRTLAAEASEASQTLHALGEGSPMPTQAAIDAARRERDLAWQAIRRRPADAAAPDILSGLIAAADTLVDQRWREADRVHRYEAGERRLADLRTDLAGSEQTRDADAGRVAQQQAAWHAAWRDAGIVPLSSAEMLEWLQQRAVVCGLLEDTIEAEALEQTLRERRDFCHQRLAAVMPAGFHPADLATGLIDAEARLQRGEALTAELRRHHEVLPALEQRAAAAAAAWSKWQVDWQAAMAALDLPAATTPEMAEDALRLWGDIDANRLDWQAAQARVDEMSQAIDSFVRDAAALVAALAPDMCGPEPVASLPLLMERLDTERASDRRRRDLERERMAAQAEAAGAHTRQLQAEAVLAALRDLAKVADDDALERAIEAASRANQLRVELQRQERLALDHGDGHSLEFLIEEARDADIDSLKLRIEAIEADQHAIGDTSKLATADLTQAREELRRLEHGRDAGQAAQDMRDAAAAMREAAQDYARTRVASLVLRHAIERYRTQQQGPMLRRAGVRFQQITNGRYSGLLADENDRGQVELRAVSAAGSELRTDQLSEGTRDQLYLALRLAAVEQYAENAEPLPFIGDDLLVNFDEARALSALRALVSLGASTQTILFTHHAHVAELAEREAGVSVSRIG